MELGLYLIHWLLSNAGTLGCGVSTFLFRHMVHTPRKISARFSIFICHCHFSACVLQFCTACFLYLYFTLTLSFQRIWLWLGGKVQLSILCAQVNKCSSKWKGIVQFVKETSCQLILLKLDNNLILKLSGFITIATQHCVKNVLTFLLDVQAGKVATYFEAICITISCVCQIDFLAIFFFQLQVTGLSWNSTGSVIAASYPFGASF